MPTSGKKRRWFYVGANTYDGWNDYYHIPTEENEPGNSHTITGDNSIFQHTKTKHKGKSKTRLVSEVTTSVESDAFISEYQKKLQNV